nr:MAG TPA: hypothetical protein [Caudoviricetes sp.]
MYITTPVLSFVTNVVTPMPSFADSFIVYKSCLFCSLANTKLSLIFI